MEDVKRIVELAIVVLVIAVLYVVLPSLVMGLLQ